MVEAGVEGKISGEVTDVAATRLASQRPRAPCNLVSALDRIVNHSVQKFDALCPWSWQSSDGERCPDGSLGGTEGTGGTNRRAGAGPVAAPPIHPSNGANSINRLAVPLRSYS